MGGDIRRWILVDKYIDHPMVKKWDATKLDEVEDGTAKQIYASHLLEHLPHTQTEDILRLWHRKMTDKGLLTINVPNLVWAAGQLIRLANGQPLNGYYYEFEGEHGLLSVFYGSQSHEGEHHHAGFTNEYLRELLERVGFKDISIVETIDTHDMGVLLANARK